MPNVSELMGGSAAEGHKRISACKQPQCNESFTPYRRTDRFQRPSSAGSTSAAEGRWLPLFIPVIRRLLHAQQELEGRLHPNW